MLLLARSNGDRAEALPAARVLFVIGPLLREYAVLIGRGLELMRNIFKQLICVYSIYSLANRSIQLAQCVLELITSMFFRRAPDSGEQLVIAGCNFEPNIMRQLILWAGRSPRDTRPRRSVEEMI